MPHESLDNLSWRREDDRGAYLVTTQPSQLDHAFINRAFASDDMAWARPLPPDQITTMLAHSTTLGLYHTPPPAPPPTTASSPSSPRTPSPTTASPSPPPRAPPTQIGLARFVTDHVTLAYLTDVYILPAYRHHGLGKWLVACGQDVMKQLPAMRRAMLLASPGVGTAFYSRELGMWDVGEERASRVVMTRKAYGGGGA
ncbi:hypothetical protein LTR08_001280 [Meristemomyces frigidus]|nr:hypothetical protein LTR08_001280 [Meristemomyces frigidus]